jgi:hypothetical protein
MGFSWHCFCWVGGSGGIPPCILNIGRFTRSIHETGRTGLNAVLLAPSIEPGFLSYAVTIPSELCLLLYGLMETARGQVC